ncbi:TetR/AcrR family transcriptional regulator [Roseiarcus fermentans]|nr:TetR/AcrR family transcriptional regulator [Roseiarcus fermentans]
MDLIRVWSMRLPEKTNPAEPATDNWSKIRRIDARRNRARIFTAAKKLFSEQSGSTRMEDIARLAGVGVGSLYRSFGNRAGLAEAIFRDILDELVEMANRLGLDRDPCSALRIWLQTYIDGLHAKRSMLGDLAPLFESDPKLLASARTKAASALATVLVRAQEAGAVRSDIDAEALTQLINGLAGSSNSAEPQRADLLLEVILDGLAARGAYPKEL